MKHSNLNKEKSFNSVFHIYFTEIAIMLTFGVVLISLYYSLNFNNQLLLSSLCTICIVILRIAPTINRIQNALYLINSNKKIVMELLLFNEKFKKNCNFEKTNEKITFNNAIQLKNICFQYPTDKNYLNNVNIKINKGDFIAIIGKSGSYKTTLALIIAGLIEPQSGEIIIDDLKLQKDDFQKWQNNISFLSQDFTLFDENIANNNDEILLSLDLKKDKISNLSSGQRQRMALVEILKQNKEILILDEITSNQDVITEEKINELLNKKKGKKTLIAITHRLSLLKHATKIIYLSDNIFDFDTFENLKNKHSEFQQMINLSNIN